METSRAPRKLNIAVSGLIVGLLSAGILMFMVPKAHAASDPYIANTSSTTLAMTQGTPYIAHSSSASCVFTVTPCANVISATLTVTQGDAIIVWSSYYPHCNTPSAGSPSDSVGDTFTSINNNAFQFAACGPTLALDYQTAYFATARLSGTVTVSVSYTTAPYEGDIIVDDVSGGTYVSNEIALCNGSEQVPCMPNGGGSFGVSPFIAPSNSLILAYGSASSYSTIVENPLNPGPGYSVDQGPVYPGGYMLDSLTEYTTTTSPTTAPINTSTSADGWGEIAIVLSGASPATVTVTQTVILATTTTSVVHITQTATQTVPTTLTVTLSTTVASTYTPSSLVPGVGNDTLILAITVLIAAALISVAIIRITGRRA